MNIYEVYNLQLLARVNDMTVATATDCVPDPVNFVCILGAAPQLR